MPREQLSQEEVLALVAKRFKGQASTWLQGGGSWPWIIRLGAPTQATTLDDLPGIRRWGQSWADWKGVGEVTFESRRWPLLGAQTLPVSLTLPDAAAVASLLSREPAWRRAVARFEGASSRWPALRERLPRHLAVLEGYSEADWTRLMDVLAWLERHPGSGLFPRQLPIHGIHSKWIEARSAVLKEWLSAIVGSGSADFYEVCGLRRPPALARLRILDPSLRASVGGVGDLTAPLEDLANLPIRPIHVLIVENLQTGLGLPDMPGTVALLRMGYVLTPIRILMASWMAHASVAYWGDLDSHGFAMLSIARTLVPGLRSVLMDRATLEAHADLIVHEDDGRGSPVPGALNPDEQALFDEMGRGRWGAGARLEQERIDWDYALVQIQL